MIFLSDFQPLSAAKINILRFTERQFSDKVHASLPDWRGPGTNYIAWRRQNIYINLQISC